MLKLSKEHFFLNSLLHGTFKIDHLVVIFEKKFCSFLEYMPFKNKIHVHRKYLSTTEKKTTDLELDCLGLDPLSNTLAVGLRANYLTFLCLWLFNLEIGIMVNRVVIDM